jgi:uncharacterized membrane protein YsdA (DUF1294 family)
MLFNVFTMVFGAISLIAFLLYATDKIKAKLGAWRIPEKALLASSLFGGAVGGYLAMLLFRHKTRHWYFTAINIVGLVWQMGLLLFFLIKGM